MLKDNHKYLQSHFPHSRRYHDTKGSNCIMLGCADSDFKIPSVIQENIVKFAEQGNLSYTYMEPELDPVIIEWLKQEHAITVAGENLVYGYGVMFLLKVAINHLTFPGDEVILNSPHYPSFTRLSPTCCINLVLVDLLHNSDKNQYEMDWEQLEIAMQSPKAKAMIVCNPHNPTGRIWTKAELTRLVALAKKYDIFLLGDEIWSDVTAPHHRYTPLISIPGVEKTSFIANSANKTFNMGANQFAYGYTLNKKFAANMKEWCFNDSMISTHGLIHVTNLVTGYTTKEAKHWLAEYRDLLQTNAIYVRQELLTKTKIKITEHESTNLVWLDFREVCPNEIELIDRLEKQEIFGSKGTAFGPNWAGHCRFVIGISHELCKDFVQRLINEFGD